MLTYSHAPNLAHRTCILKSTQPLMLCPHEREARVSTNKSHIMYVAVQSWTETCLRTVLNSLAHHHIHLLALRRSLMITSRISFVGIRCSPITTPTTIPPPPLHHRRSTRPSSALDAGVPAVGGGLTRQHGRDRALVRHVPRRWVRWHNWCGTPKKTGPKLCVRDHRLGTCKFVRGSSCEKCNLCIKIMGPSLKRKHIRRLHYKVRNNNCHGGHLRHWNVTFLSLWNSKHPH